MEIIKGKSILNKVAIGPILYHRKTESQVKRRTVENTEAEISRYEAAVKYAEDELKALHKKACEQVGETGVRSEYHQKSEDERGVRSRGDR